MNEWLECDLFLGFPLLPSFEAKLQQANPYAAALFLHKEEKRSKNESYLSVIKHNGQSYVGKFVDSPLGLEQIELIEANIYSLAKRVIPTFSPNETPLHLFAMARSSHVSS